jgi:hydroxymethylglutaryl-CoA lyase
MPVSILGMGNVPTEDVVHLFREMGIETGVNLEAIRELSNEVGTLLGVPSVAKIAQFGTFEEFNEMAQQYR